LLKEEFKQWMKASGETQIDDVLLLGFKPKSLPTAKRKKVWKDKVLVKV
jgi:hypothetical protein